MIMWAVAGSDPVNFIDSSGLVVCGGFCIGGIIVGGITVASAIIETVTSFSEINKIGNEMIDNTKNLNPRDFKSIDNYLKIKVNAWIKIQKEVTDIAISASGTSISGNIPTSRADIIAEGVKSGVVESCKD